METLVSHEPQVHYAEIRPMRTIGLTEQQLMHVLNAGGSITMDCSESVTCLCKWAGLSDPNGLGFNGSGYTGTLLTHLPHYSNPKVAQTGALVVFGPGTGDHVCMVLEPDHKDGNPLLWSLGQERGPLKIRLHDEASFHRSPVTFLSIAHL